MTNINIRSLLAAALLGCLALPASIQPSFASNPDVQEAKSGKRQVRVKGKKVSKETIRTKKKETTREISKETLPGQSEGSNPGGSNPGGSGSQEDRASSGN